MIFPENTQTEPVGTYNGDRIGWDDHGIEYRVSCFGSSNFNSINSPNILFSFTVYLFIKSRTKKLILEKEQFEI